MRKMNLLEVDPIWNEDRTMQLFESVGLTAVLYEEQLSIAKTVMEPYSSGTKHYHIQSKEIYVFISGSAEVVVDNKTFNVSAEDLIMIYPFERHNVITRAEPVSFLAITLPAYSPHDFIID
ncbi:MAG: cupin domain-containing protein [Smithella sp.]